MSTNTSTDLAPNGKPKVIVKLVGEDGNAFAVMGRVTSAMKKAGWSREDIDKYTKSAMSGDYDNLLRATLSYASEPSRSSGDHEDCECIRCGDPTDGDDYCEVCFENACENCGDPICRGCEDEDDED